MAQGKTENIKNLDAEFYQLLKIHYGLNANDVDERVISECLHDDWTPWEILDWISKKYNLVDIKGHNSM